MDTSSQPTPLWLTILIGALVPLLTAYIGWQAGNNSLNKDYVQIAAQIAQSSDSPKPLKQWAAKLLNAMSPVPFGDDVEESIAVYPARNLTYENFTMLPKNFLNGEIAKPCANHDIIFRKRSITMDDAITVLESYKECELRHSAMIKSIGKMKTLSDQIAVESRIREERGKAKAGDPFGE